MDAQISSNLYSISTSSSLALQTQSPTVPSSWQAVTGTGTEGKLQAVTLESAPTQQSDKKKSRLRVSNRRGGWYKNKMTHLRCTKTLNVSFFHWIASLLIQRTNMQKIYRELLKNCRLLWFAWVCSESQNLPKMKKTVPDSHTAADAAERHKECSSAARNHSPRMLSLASILANISFLDLNVLFV